MNTNLHLTFPGTCREAFAFYEQTFGSKILLILHYGEAPGGPPPPPELEGKVLHVAMPVGSITLMGCDAPAHSREALGGFQIAIDTDEAEVHRLFGALSEAGRVMMPLGPTFWSPLFGMCKDKFGVGWMVGVAPAAG